MAIVRADPDSLREFVVEAQSTGARLREGWDTLIRGWFVDVRNAWDDDAARETEQQLTAVNYALRNCLDALELGARRLASHAGRLEAYLSSSPVPLPVRAPSLVVSPPSTSTPKPASARWGPTGTTVSSRAGQPLELWSFAGASPGDFDWGDEAFPTAFETESHHGNTADVYRRWVSAAANVVGQVREQGWDAVSGDEARQVRDVFMGSEPPRIVLRGDGSKPVVESRHRVLAAVKQGVTIPVHVVRLPPPKASDRASPASCSACGGGLRCGACGGSGRTVGRDRSLSFDKRVRDSLERGIESGCPACAGTGACPRCSGQATARKP